MMPDCSRDPGEPNVRPACRFLLPCNPKPLSLQLRQDRPAGIIVALDPGHGVARILVP